MMSNLPISMRGLMALCVISSASILVGCADDRVLDAKVSRNGIRSELIAEVDNCRLWQVNIPGRNWVYLARCKGGDNTVSAEEGGKHKYLEQTIGVTE